MKKTVLCLALLAGLSRPALSQNEDYPLTFCANVGQSVVGKLFDAAYEVSGSFSGTEVKSKVLPAFQLTGDYAVSNKISLGGAFSWQSLGAEVKNWQYYDANNNLQTENFKTNLNRINIAGRVLFHYGELEKIDMYSGARIGYTIWSGSTDSKDPENSVDKDFSSSFAPQLIAFGIRGYFTDNFGANLEVAIGPPHYLSFGLNYRLGN